MGQGRAQFEAIRWRGHEFSAIWSQRPAEVDTARREHTSRKLMVIRRFSSRQGILCLPVELDRPVRYHGSVFLGLSCLSRSPVQSGDRFWRVGMAIRDEAC
jgi:hypothetical protein